MRTVSSSGCNAGFALGAIRHMGNVVRSDLRASGYVGLWQWLSILYNNIVIDIHHVAIVMSVNVLIVGFNAGVTNILPSVFFAFAGPFID